MLKKLKIFLIVMILIPFACCFTSCKKGGGDGGNNGTIEDPITPDEPDPIDPNPPAPGPDDPDPPQPEEKYYVVNVNYNLPEKFAVLKTNTKNTLKTTETFTIPEIDAGYSDYFLGWFDASNDAKIDSSTITGTADQNITIYAKWDEENFTKYCQLGGLTYETDETEKTATVIGISREQSIVIIPRIYKKDGVEYRVNKIGISAFANHDISYVLTYADNIEIDNFAFTNTKLFDFDFSNVTSVGESAFEDTLITKAEFSFLLTNLGKSAFKNCTRLETIDLTKASQSADTIYESMFEGCKSLKDVKLHNNFSTVGDNAFKNCVALENVDFLSKSYLTSIGNYAFEGCSSLTVVTLSENLSTIGVRVFDKCSKIEEISISNLFYKTWGNDNFSYFYGDLSSSLKTIKLIGANITKINESYFNNYANLETFVMCNSVTVVEKAFQNDTNLKNITFSTAITPENFDVSVFKDTAWYKSGTEMVKMNNAIYYAPRSITGNIVVEEGILTIAGSAFEDTKITSITLPSSLTSIGNNAFQNCSELAAVEFRGETSALTSIGIRAFYNCKKLAEINLSKCVGLENIGSRAFFKVATNAKIAKFYIPGTVVALSGDVFGLAKIEEFELVGSSNNYVCEAGALFEKDFDGNKVKVVAYPAAKQDALFVLPETVTELDGYSFAASLVSTIYIESDSNLNVSNYAFFNTANFVKILYMPKTNFDIISSNPVKSSDINNEIYVSYGLKENVDYEVSNDGENVALTLKITDLPTTSNVTYFVKFMLNGQTYCYKLTLVKNNVGTEESPVYEISITRKDDLSNLFA